MFTDPCASAQSVFYLMILSLTEYTMNARNFIYLLVIVKNQTFNYLCGLCALCGEKSCTQREAKERKVFEIYVKNIIRF